MVTELRFIQLLLALPIVVPLVGSWMRARCSEPQWLVQVMGLLQMALIIGGIPYVVFAACALYWLRGRSSAAYLRFVLAAPVLFAIVLGAIAFAAVCVWGPHDFGGFVLVPLYYAGLALGVGYVYVLAAYPIFWIGRRLGWLSTTSA